MSLILLGVTGNNDRPAAAGYHADAETYFARILTNGGSALDTTHKGKYSNGIAYLDAQGVWSKIDRLWILKNQNQVAALTSLKNPASSMMSPVSSPTFTADTGLITSGSQYMDANYIPSVDGVQMTTNSVWMGRGIVGNTDGVYVEAGANDGQRRTFIEAPTGGVYYFAANTSSGSYGTRSFTADDSHVHANRTSSSNIRGYVGNAYTDVSDTQNGLCTKSIFLGAYNNNGTAQYHKAGTYTWFGLGADLDASIINYAMTNYFL